MERTTLTTHKEVPAKSKCTQRVQRVHIESRQTYMKATQKSEAPVCSEAHPWNIYDLTHSIHHQSRGKRQGELLCLNWTLQQTEWTGRSEAQNSSYTDPIRGNQQLQRSFSNHSKPLVFLKPLNTQCDSTLIKYLFLVNNSLGSMGEPSTRASFTSWRRESPTGVKYESGPVDPRPLCGAGFPQSTLWTNALGFPGGSVPIGFEETAGHHGPALLQTRVNSFHDIPEVQSATSHCCQLMDSTMEQNKFNTQPWSAGKFKYGTKITSHNKTEPLFKPPKVCSAAV